MQNITKPKVITGPFARNGLKNDIPENPTGTYLASVEEGFPAITMQPISLGGTPPEGKDFNGAFNLMSQFYFAFQNGWMPTFDADVSAAIGGYAQGAILWYTPSGTKTAIPLQSQIPNNTYNFNEKPDYIGQYWAYVITGTSDATLLDCKFTDHILDDISWLRADTFSWQSGSVYVAAYQHLTNDISDKRIFYAWSSPDDLITVYTKSRIPKAGDLVYEWGDVFYNQEPVKARKVVLYNEDNDAIEYGDDTIPGNSVSFIYNSEKTAVALKLDAESETIGGTTIYFYRATDGHKIVLPDQADAVQAIYDATGVAWYYILDTENIRFKLPRTKWGLVGLRDGAGNYVSESLPNISFSTNTNQFKGGRNSTNNGAIKFINGAAEGVYGSGSGGYFGLDFKASYQNPVYQDNAPVQSRATEMYLYFYVGNFSQSAIEQTAGLNTEAFNGKIDLPSGATQTTVDFVVDSQMPSVDNNYTWYRKYKSGWVEQGGLISLTGSVTNITLPVAMADTNYCALASSRYITTASWVVQSVIVQSDTQIAIQANAETSRWEVKGVSA